MKRYTVSARGIGRSDDEWAEVEYEAEAVEDCFNMPKPKSMAEAIEKRWVITKICESGRVVWSGFFIVIDRR